MKISLITTAIIVVLFAWYGRQVRQHLETSREKHERVTIAARELGIGPAIDGSGSRFRSKIPREDSQSAREMKAKAVARKLAVFGNDTEASSSNNSDKAKQQEYLEGLDEVAHLDTEGLKLLVCEIMENGELTADTRSHLLLTAGYSITEKNPALAIGLFIDTKNRLQLPDDVPRTMIGTALHYLASESPSKALDWIRKNSDEYPGLFNERTKSIALAGMVKSDAKLAFSTLNEFGLTNNASVLEKIGAAAETPAQRSSVLEALRGYAAKASDEERQLSVTETLGGMADNLTQGKYDAAASWLNSAKLTPDEISRMVGHVDVSKTKGETGKWIDWMSDQIPADQLDTKVTELVNQWTTADHQAAGTWLISTPEGPAKNIAVRSYASTVASTDPAAASQWALTLPAGEERSTLMKNIYIEWQKQDVSAARKFAQDYGIQD